MIIGRIITEFLNTIIQVPLLLREGRGLALTPVQRWKAAGEPFNTSFIVEHWFMLLSVAALITLTTLFIVVSRRRIIQERRMGSELFVKYAEKSGLSERERQFLLDIAIKAKLKHSEAIFTMGSAFERGAAVMMKESVAKKQTAKQIERLRLELSFLREKLGFQKRAMSSIGSSAKQKKLSSRQIPVGKKVHMTRGTDNVTDSIESTVIENTNVELVVKLERPVKIIFGEVWRVHYYFGVSIWEFDTSVISCNGDILVLNHSDDLRFVNRRRFLRVPVNKPAFVAHFPFTRTPAADARKSMKSFRMYRSSASVSGSIWGPPEFIPAVVTELAGPGLRIEAPLKTEVGDRVLVVLRLDEEEPDSAPQKREGKSSILKIVEDIGEVRHTKDIPNGFSIAVELTGLSDSDVNELIRATNAASLKTRLESQDISVSENAGETVAMQGVQNGRDYRPG
jgi:hypothetical protein